MPALPIKDGVNPSRVRVPAEAAGLTAGQYLAAVIAGQRHRHPDDDDHALDRRFSGGQVRTRQGRILTPDDPVTVGEDIFFYRIPVDRDLPVCELPIVFSDRHLTVVDKPHGLATVPKGAHIIRSVVVQARRATGNMDLVPVHRLDRLTRGLVVCANNPAERGAYQQLFADTKVDKTYTAIAAGPAVAGGGAPDVPDRVCNRLKKTHGQLQAQVEDGACNAVTVIDAVTVLTDDQARRAVALFGPPAVDCGAQPVGLYRFRLRPRTGKTHQLRKHLADLGYGILGDPLYPVVDRPRLNDTSAPPLALACTGISFTDPVTGGPRRFSLQGTV